MPKSHKTLWFAFVDLLVPHGCVCFVRFWGVHFAGYSEEGGSFHLNCVEVLHFEECFISFWGEKKKEKNLSVCIVAGIFSRSINSSYLSAGESRKYV